MTFSHTTSPANQQKPRLSFWQIWNVSFGFLGVQFGFALQNANASRILSDLGADLHSLSLFWLVAPIMGLIIQPLVGSASDRTWNRLGRRNPYILAGGIAAAIGMLLMPNSSTLASFITPLFFGAMMLALMDASFNLAFQPFRALVSDMVPSEQRNIGYSIQSFLINIGAVFGSILPFVLTNVIGLENTATAGSVAPSVIWAFYIGASVMLGSVLWTVFKTKEYAPGTNGLALLEQKDQTLTFGEKLTHFFGLMKTMPTTMKQLALVQFFSWFALFIMWVYTMPAITQHIWNIDAKWFDIKTGKNEIDFKIKDNMSPNVYAYVSAIQAQPNTGNNLPLRTYGIIPIHVDNSNSILKPRIEVASKIEPESKLKIKVSETNGKNMTYTLAVVDEGLLGISGYKTPNPWKFFYSKEALGVLTWDMFDAVVGAFTGVYQDVFSIGGGEEELEQMNKAKSNRYESVVKYLGPFELNGGSNSHTIDVPNYVGNLKLMVVAGGKNYGFGNATQDVQVAQPLMVLGTLPRVLSIDEDVELPVNVFVTDKAIKNVSIEVHTDDKVQLIGDRKQSMKFSSVSDQITNFKIKTGNKQTI